MPSRPLSAAAPEHAPATFRHPSEQQSRSRRPERGPRVRRGWTLDVRVGEHVRPAVQTRRRQRQPHVDGDRHYTARHSPATVSRRFRRRRRCAPRRGRLLTSPPRRRPSPLQLQPAEDVAGVERPASRLDRREDLPLEPWVERRLGRSPSAGWPARTGPDPTRRSPTPVPAASGRTASDARQSTGAPAVVIRTAPLRLSPRIIIARQTTRARSRATKSLRAAVL